MFVVLCQEVQHQFGIYCVQKKKYIYIYRPRSSREKWHLRSEANKSMPIYTDNKSGLFFPTLSAMFLETIAKQMKKTLQNHPTKPDVTAAYGSNHSMCNRQQTQYCILTIPSKLQEVYIQISKVLKTGNKQFYSENFWLFRKTQLNKQLPAANIF